MACGLEAEPHTRGGTAIYDFTGEEIHDLTGLVVDHAPKTQIVGAQLISGHDAWSQLTEVVTTIHRNFCAIDPGKLVGY